MSIDSELTISQTDGRPMYLQIIEQIQHKVAVGDWEPGMVLPSIRQLAADLRISVITVKRAYQDLEREGVIVTQQGRGSVVSYAPGMRNTLWEEELSQALSQAARLGSLLGVSPDTMHARLQSAIQKLKDE
jgi:GntR family transcriptional regulator